MNRHSSINAVPLLAGLIVMFALSTDPLQAQEKAATARLTLEGANGENHCTLDFKTGKYDFEGNSYCNNDEAVGVELEHVPSASNILLFDDYTCDRSDDGNYFWIYLRTVKEDVTVPPIDLDQIMTMPKGAVIVPGVRVMDYYQKPGETPKERTSCVHIEVDAPPLTPLTRNTP
jgi:hypothetical protein